MTRVSMDELVSEVRIALDENMKQTDYMESNADNLELNEIIRTKLPEAARDVTETAAIGLLEPEIMKTTEISTNGESSGTLTIPDDFLRIVSIRLKGWNRSVTEIADEGSPIEMMQRNRFVRGTRIKPVCVFSHDNGGKRVIEFFGNGTEVEKALYMPVPKVQDDDTLPISRLLRQAIVRRAAGLVLLSRGETEMATVFLS